MVTGDNSKMEHQTTAIVNWLKRDIKNENTPIIGFCGRPRSGKTLFAMRCAWEIYPDKFSFENVVNTVEDFAKLMKKLKHSIIILDEASTSLYVYDWNSYLHKVFQIINDSQAFRHNVVFIICPSLGKLDSLTKQDFDCIVEMRKTKGYDPFDRKFKKIHTYKYWIQHKQYSRMAKWKPMMSFIGEFAGVPLPPDHILKPYMAQGQNEFKEKILDQQLDLIIKKSAGSRREEVVL